jgi:RNA polymerase sigma factor (sigma-70 family)
MVEVGDRTKEAFQRLAGAELPALYWLARRLVRDGAEDLVQEALLRAYRSYGTLRQDAAAGPWLKCILVNMFRDQLRRQARSVEELPVEQVEDFSPPRRSPTCSMSRWGRSWPGCIAAASGSSRSCGRMPRRPDSC